MLRPTATTPPATPIAQAGDAAYRDFLRRMALLTVLFVVEAVALSLWLDTESLAHSTHLAGVVGHWGAFALRAAVGFVVIFVTFAFLKDPAAIHTAARFVTERGIDWGLLAAHSVSLAVFAAISATLFAAGDTVADVTVIAWFLAGCAAVAFAAFAFLPIVVWHTLLRATGVLWLYALATVLFAAFAGTVAQSLWRPATSLTFELTRRLLHSFVPVVVADPGKLLLGTPRFRVFIAPECSGLEGAALALAFGGLWLLLFRRETRFPRALLLLPAAVLLSFALNVVRLTALVLIGNAGFRQIAARGFHSQAGWIFFNLGAVTFCLVASRVPYFRVAAKQADAPARPVEDATSAYLLPFLAILAAGMLSVATSAGFEWLYGLRLVAAATVLWIYRHRYAELDWRAGWPAGLVGIAVFAIWLTPDWLAGNLLHQTMPAELQAVGGLARWSWIAVRSAAMVLTVPVAEELAFRGFLLRRLTSPGFTAIRFRDANPLGLLLSSALFGVLHPGHILVGIVAGVLFGWLVMRTGRIGDAVLAHATANALLVGYILGFQHWSLW